MQYPEKSTKIETFSPLSHSSVVLIILSEIAIQPVSFSGRAAQRAEHPNRRHHCKNLRRSTYTMPKAPEQRSGSLHPTKGRGSSFSDPSQVDHFESLFLECPIPVLVVDPVDGMILEANASATLLLGYSREQFRQRSFMDFLRRDPGEVRTILQSVETGCTASFPGRVRAVNGRPIDVETVIRCIDLNGLRVLCCILHDLTVRNVRENDFIETQKLLAVDMLAAAITHDFNNVLAAILGFAEMTRKERELLPPSVLQNQEQIIQAVGKARALVTQIRTFAQFDAPRDEAPVIVPDEAIPESSVPPAGARILFVDDEEILVSLGKGVLEHLGYEVVAVQSPGEALNLVRSAPDRFDLLVTDHVMPKMTGAQLVREIASIRPGLPAIVCSGTLSAAVEEGTCIPAIRRFVSKPFSITELDRTIAEVLESVRPARTPRTNPPGRH